jgi:REP element-mobilizing transposase RayT
MPRKARMFLPDVPCHIICRGNNRDACFYTDDDYLFYLANQRGQSPFRKIKGSVTTENHSY